MLNLIQVQKAEENSPVEKIHQRFLNTENDCLWLKLSPGDRLPGARVQEERLQHSLPPGAACTGRAQNRGGWAGQLISLLWCAPLTY